MRSTSILLATLFAGVTLASPIPNLRAIIDAEVLKHLQARGDNTAYPYSTYPYRASTEDKDETAATEAGVEARGDNTAYPYSTYPYRASTEDKAEVEARGDNTAYPYSTYPYRAAAAEAEEEK